MSTIPPDVEPSFTVSGSVDCSGDGLQATVKVTNTGSIPFELGQMGVFPYGPLGDSMLPVFLGYPGPTMQPRDSFEAEENLGSSEYAFLTQGSEVDLYADVSVDGVSTAVLAAVTCP